MANRHRRHRPDHHRRDTPPNAPRPSSSPGGDHRVIDRVRGLLAKAESTTFPKEAESLTAKAQELIARYSIDQAMVEQTLAGSGGGGADQPSGLRIGIDDPYCGAKALLLTVVARANSCQAIWSQDLGISTVFGFDADLQAVELLYASLLVQATSAMVAAGPQVDRYGRSRTRSFRQAFLVAYAERIGDRLREAGEVGRLQAEQVYGEALLPVLASRAEAVEGAVEAEFGGRIRRRTTSVSNWAGVQAGRAAAERARLFPHEEITG